MEADSDANNPMVSAAYKVATELYFGPLWGWRQSAGEAGPSGGCKGEPETESATRAQQRVHMGEGWASYSA